MQEWWWLAAGLAVLLINVLMLVMLWRLRWRLQADAQEQQRDALSQLHDSLARQTQQLGSVHGEQNDRLRSAVHGLQLAQGEMLAANRLELMREMGVLQQKQQELKGELLGVTLERLAEQARADQQLIQTTFRNVASQLTQTIEVLTKTVDGRLDAIGGKMHERLEEGFRKTNETFTNVMTRLATIDQAQKNIEDLASNVVSLQQLLGDKRSRGAFGEVQLEALVRNMLPPSAYDFQYTLPNATRVDCVLHLPEPTGMVAVDAKFPMENYHRMLDEGLSEFERAAAQRQFKLDLRRHVDDIAQKYILPEVTSEGAVMFVPAEAVFAEVHAHHTDVVDHAMQRRVWIVSPTTLMAVLNTARAVIKDVETRRQVHIIKDELGKLGREFGRFDERMRKLAQHIQQAHEDAQDVATTSKKISARFNQIERVELEQPAAPLQLIEGDRDS